MQYHFFICRDMISIIYIYLHNIMFASKHVMTYTLSPTNIGVTHVVRCTQALLSNIPCKPCHFRGSLNFQTSILPNHQWFDLPNNHNLGSQKVFEFLTKFVSSSPSSKKWSKRQGFMCFFSFGRSLLDFEGPYKKLDPLKTLQLPKELLLLNSAGRPRETPWASPNARPLKRLGVARWKGYIGMCKKSMPLVSFRWELLHT